MEGALDGSLGAAEASLDETGAVLDVPEEERVGNFPFVAGAFVVRFLSYA